MEDIILNEISFLEFIASQQPSLLEEKYKNEYASFKKLKKNDLPYIYDTNHFAKLTGISTKQLNFFIHSKNKAYCSFRVPKKMGGFRRIDAPSKKMKYIQKWILRNILYKLNSGNYSHGFLPGKSIATNASVHVGQKLVLGIDLKKFFPTISLKRVNGLFKSLGYNEEVAFLLAEVCTFKQQLPQGAPTSPMISNLIGWHLDNKLSKFCLKRNLNYSRYADDITISGGTNLPKYKTLIFNKITEEGFKVNFDKLRLHSNGSCQKVTGLVVNEKLSIGRKRKKCLRALVHNIAKNGPIVENRKNDPFFRERVFGYLGHAKMVEPSFATPLIETLKQVDWEPYETQLKLKMKNEIELRSLKRNPHLLIIPFDRFKIFKGIEQVPANVRCDDEFRTTLNKLLEKCKHHKKINCYDCLHMPDVSHEACMKYILGHIVGTTGGHHHGHELYDIGETMQLDDDFVFVAFLAKSKDDTNANNSLFRQFFNCAYEDTIDVISIVTNCNLSHELNLNLRKVLRDCGPEHLCCLIQRDEMARILYHFNQKYSLTSSASES